MQQFTILSVDIFAAATLVILISIARAEILTFGPHALPACAYGCTPLYSAQFDCPAESVAGVCFCQSPYIAPALDSGSICRDICPPGGGGEEVKLWLQTACKEFTNSSGKPEREDDDLQWIDEGEDEKEEDRDNAPESPKQFTKTGRAIEWWKKHWQWFLMAFLLVALPITFYALLFPVRKWWRRRKTARRFRQSLGINLPTSTVYNQTNPAVQYATGGLPSPGLEVHTVGKGWQRGRWDGGNTGGGYVPAVRKKAGVGYFPEMQQVSLAQTTQPHPSRPGSRNPPQPHQYSIPGHLTSIGAGTPQQSASTIFQAGSTSYLGEGPIMSGALGNGTSVRQHTWERQMRAEFEKESLLSKLAFWRTKNRDQV